MSKRVAEISRKTGETDIQISLNIDGNGDFQIDTGIGFFDHMLSLMAKHGSMDLMIKAVGDINVDCHHTVEDVGIVLGKCFQQASLDREGIKRYGTVFLPMDETLALVSVDVSGRPFLVFDAVFTSDRVGAYDTEMTEEFFRALAINAGITLHAKILYGKNNHHMTEALFKALGKALSEALKKDGNIKGVMSTKGIL